MFDGGDIELKVGFVPFATLSPIRLHKKTQKRDADQFAKEPAGEEGGRGWGNVGLFCSPILASLGF